MSRSARIAALTVLATLAFACAGPTSTTSSSGGGSSSPHGVQLLQRAGYPGKQMMADTLSWLMQTTGGSSGGFLATHPGTADRIAAVKALPDP